MLSSPSEVPKILAQETADCRDRRLPFVLCAPEGEILPFSFTHGAALTPKCGRRYSDRRGQPGTEARGLDSLKVLWLFLEDLFTPALPQKWAHSP